MECWFCRGRMLWMSDFDFEDFCLEGEGIVAVLRCTECGATAHFYSGESDDLLGGTE